MAIELISKIKPKNNGNFKLVDVEDIEYNGKGLDEAIASGEFKGDKGDRGDVGPIGPAGPTGPKGDNGNDGFSPTVSVTEDSDGITVTVQNKASEQTAKVKNGKNYEHSEEFSALAEQVRADKESVEQSKTSVEQTVAQAEGKIDTAGAIAVQDVQDEGTTQTEKVTVEGTKQITEIQSKGEEILHSFPQDFPTQMDTKLDKQQGTEHAGKALVIGEDGNVVPGEVQSSGGDGIAIVNTMSGESLLVIPDSAERVNKGFGLTGKTEQVQTSGKQMLNEELLKSLSNYTSNGTDYYYYRISGLEVGKKYTVSRGDVKTGKNALLGISVNQESTNKAKFLVYDGLGTSYNNASITWEQTTGEYVDILFSVSGSVTSTTQERLSEFWGRISYVQLEKGTTATPYEPYTGGKPSPSPEYPQEIKNSGKWNEEKQKYEVDVKITGKNLFDVNYFTKNENYQNKDGDATYWKIAKMKVKPNTSYMLSKSKSVTVNGAINSVISYVGALGFNNNVNSVKVTTNATGILYIMFFYRNEDVNILKELDIQVELGETLTEYEPYKEQTLTLTSDRPITKLDRLVEQGGQIGWLYKSRIAEIPKTGYALKDTNENRYGVYFSKTSIFKDAVVTKGSSEKDSNIFTHFKLGNPYASNGNIAWLYVAGGNTDLRIKVDDETINTVELFEQYISDKDVQILYETETTEFAPLPQSEQNAIRALTTYYPTTVISIDGGELDPDVEITYTADTKNYIDNKFAQLQKSLINTQVQLL